MEVVSLRCGVVEARGRQVFCEHARGGGELEGEGERGDSNDDGRWAAGGAEQSRHVGRELAAEDVAEQSGGGASEMLQEDAVEGG